MPAKAGREKFLLRLRRCSSRYIRSRYICTLSWTNIPLSVSERAVPDAKYLLHLCHRGCLWYIRVWPVWDPPSLLADVCHLIFSAGNPVSEDESSIVMLCAIPVSPLYM